MEYELRKWGESDSCLYTDDRRVKDLALGLEGLTIVGSYFRTLDERQPFAWDIVGEREVLEGIAERFGRRGRSPLVRSA